MFPVQIVALFFLAFFIALAFWNFRKAVMIWVPCSLLFNPMVCVIYFPRALPLTLTVNAIYVAIFIVKSLRFSGNYNTDKFHLKKYMIAMAISVILSTMFARIPFTASLNNIIKSYVIGWGMVYVFFKCIYSQKDTSVFLKSCIIVALIITINGLVEFITYINPIGDFIYWGSPKTEGLEDRSFYIPYIVTGHVRQRWGMPRCYSCFNLHITFGAMCALMFFVLFTYVKNHWLIVQGKITSFWNNKWASKIVSVLLIVGVICSNSKTPIVGFIIVLLAFYNIRSFFKIKTIIPLILVLTIMMAYVPNFFNNIFSLFDDDLAEEDGGSTLATRKEQLGFIMKLFHMNPIVGNGLNAAIYYSKNVRGFEGILGAESIWFKLLADQGIIGCIAYIMKYVTYYKMGKRWVPKRMIYCYLLALLVMETATGSISVLFTSAVFFIICKSYQLKQAFINK